MHHAVSLTDIMQKASASYRENFKYFATTYNVASLTYIVRGSDRVILEDILERLSNQFLM